MKTNIQIKESRTVSSGLWVEKIFKKDFSLSEPLASDKSASLPLINLIFMCASAVKSSNGR